MFAKNKHKILIFGQKRTFWRTKGRKGKKGSSQGNDGFQKGGCRPCQPGEGAGNGSSQNQDKGKVPKRNRQGRSSSSLRIVRPLKHLKKKGKRHAWESGDWSSIQWPDGSWAPAAGWFSTQFFTAWMAVPSWKLAYHPTYVSGSRLHTIIWIEISNRKISETFFVLRCSDRILLLQQIVCVRTQKLKLAWKKMHYSLFNNTTMFIHG